MTASSKASGDFYEAVAARYLTKHGVRLIDKNVRFRGGEIDLIGYDGDTLVFFEVRYRAAGSQTSAAESVSASKQQRLVRSAKTYLHRHSLWDTNARIDVIAIAPGIVSRYRIQWLRNAIEATS